MQTLCQAAAPLLWGKLYTMGLGMKPPQPGRFYVVIGAAALVQLGTSESDIQLKRPVQQSGLGTTTILSGQKGSSGEGTCFVICCFELIMRSLV